MLQFFHKGLPRHRPIALFVYIADTREILVRDGLYQEPLFLKYTTLRLHISKKVLILRMRLKIVEMDTLTKEEVQSFLEQFHAKLKIFGIIYRDDRGKNQKTLEELEIKPSFRTVVIESLQTEDYIEGPVVDKLNMLGDMWVFGKDVKGREVYVSRSTWQNTH